MSRDCLWDRYWARAGQLLVNFCPVPEVFAIVNSVQSPFRWMVYWILILLKLLFKIVIKNKLTVLQKIFPKTKLHNHNNLERKGVGKFFRFLIPVIN